LEGIIHMLHWSIPVISRECVLSYLT
jgi:hypothetical protein